MTGRAQDFHATRRTVLSALTITAMTLVALLVGAPASGVALTQPAITPSPAVATSHQPHPQLVPLEAEQVWQLSTGAGVVVAVLDSGVDADHPDLAGRVLPGLDLVDGSTDGRYDPVGHGTTVASLVAGAGDPAVGLAPDATILPVRVLDENNRYQEASTIAEGVVWAVDQGAEVINLSLGGPRESQALSLALAYAMANDVVVVACTGNLTSEEYLEVWYPAREPGVVAVAGIDFVGERPTAWPASLTGPETVLSAPAVVTGSRSGGGRRDVQGTSFASAVVAGAAAVLRAHDPQLAAADVVHRLVTTAQDLGSPGRDPDFGYGAVDPLAALTATSPSVPVNPLDTRARHGQAGLGTAPERPWHLTGDPATPTPASASATAPAGAPAGAERTGQAAVGMPAWLLLSIVVAVATGLGLTAAAAARRSHRRSHRPRDSVDS